MLEQLDEIESIRRIARSIPVIASGEWNLDRLRAILESKEIQSWEKALLGPFGLKKMVAVSPGACGITGLLVFLGVGGWLHGTAGPAAIVFFLVTGMIICSLRPLAWSVRTARRKHLTRPDLVDGRGQRNGPRGYLRLLRAKYLAVKEIRRLRKELSLVAAQVGPETTMDESLHSANFLVAEVLLFSLEFGFGKPFLPGPLESSLTLLESTLEPLYEANLIDRQQWNLDRLRAILDCDEVRRWDAVSMEPFGLRKYLLGAPLPLVIAIGSFAMGISLINGLIPKRIGPPVGFFVMILSMALFVTHFLYVRMRTATVELDQSPS